MIKATDIGFTHYPESQKGMATSAENLSQAETDARNLEFYAMMFRANRWELRTISWTVFEATLNEIAARIREKETK